MKLTAENHLTLAFLGDIEYVDKIKEKLNKVEFKKFSLETDEIGFFPNADYVKVIWIGFKESVGLVKLKEEIDKVLDFKDDKEFKPHLTIGRVKFVKDKDLLKEKFRSVNVPKIQFIVSEFKLIKSELFPEGPKYEVLETFK